MRSRSSPHSVRNPGMALIIAMAIYLVFGSGQAMSEIKLVFGAYTADKPTSTVRKLKPVLRYLEAALSRKLGEKVTISTQIARTYEKGIDSLVNGDVDFARFGPASYVIAKQRSNGVTLLAMEAVKGKKTFSGIIAVKSDSPIQTIAELRGKTFAFGSRFSTIGRYLSQSQLLNAGIRGDDLKRFDYLDRHDRVGTAVGAGEFEAGALKESTFNKLKKNNVAIREIYRFDNVTKPWIARSGLKPRLSDALREALLEVKDPVVLKAIKKSGFLSGQDADYDFVRSAMEKSRQFDS